MFILDLNVVMYNAIMLQHIYNHAYMIIYKVVVK